MLANADRLLIAGGEPAVTPSVISALRCRLETWLEKLRAETEAGTIGPAPLPRMVNETIVSALDAIVAPEEASVSIATTRPADH